MLHNILRDPCSSAQAAGSSSTCLVRLPLPDPVLDCAIVTYRPEGRDMGIYSLISPESRGGEDVSGE